LLLHKEFCAPTNYLRYRDTTLLAKLLELFVVVLPSTGPETDSEAKTFRWVHATSDPQLWEQILTSFNDELTPDEPQQGRSELDVYRYKYLQKVGVLNHSALVIIGRRPAKEMTKENEWDEYYSAFQLRPSYETEIEY
jgi:hypothetical protein